MTPRGASSSGRGRFTSSRGGRITRGLAFVALILALTLVHQTVRAQTPPPTSPTPRPPNTATLDIENVRVIDGDTIEFWNDTIWGVGFIGVDAPSGNTACGEEATGRLWELLGGGVHLEEETGFSLDARGRRWYHASIVDGRLVGEILIKEGLAKTTSQTHKYARLYKAAEQDASAARRGCVWGGPSPARPQQQATPGPSAEPLAALPGGFVTDVVASGLTDPTAIALLPDGRIFIAQKNGVVRLVKNGALQATPVIDIQDRVNDYWDHGLIGMAVNPNFAANPYIYLLYTYENNAGAFEGPKSGRLARYTVTGDTAAPSSQLVLLGSAAGAGCPTVTADCIPSESVTHSVGAVKVADDGTLFVTTGDASAFTYVDDMALRTQNLDSLAGKLLHISATTGQGISTNPFWTGNAGANKSKVYAYGLRNAYRFNLRPGSGTPYVGDVGWDEIEEVSAVLPGSNLGWPCYEGPQQQAGYASKPQCQALYAQGLGAVRLPIVSWLHSDAPCCSSAVTAGAFYTGATYPAAYQGKYFYGDYAKSWIRYLEATDTNTLVAGSIGTFEPAGDGPVDIEMGPDENLYYLSIYTGQLRRIRYVGGGNHPPTAVAVANPTSGNAPLAVQFSSTGSYDSDANPLAYAWNFGDGASSTQPNPSHTYTTNGNYSATLTLTDGQGGSDVETIPISVGNGAPTATITSPASDFTYKVDDTMAFAGTASDPEQGTLSGAALSWTVVIHHCPGGGLCHTHAYLSTTGDGDSFVVPDHGNDFYFEFILTATDSGGLTGSTSVSVFPQTVPLTVNSDPPGLQLIFDGQVANGPITRNSVIGSVHSVEAITPQGENQFTGWSDGQPQFHYIVTPATASSVIATYSGPMTITFDDKAGQDQPLTGEYPTGVIDWGSTNKWLHSSPWLAFTTKSLTFYGPGINSASFSFVTPRRLLRLDMLNGGPTSSTVTIACAGQPTKTQVVASGQLLPAVATGWTAACSPVTISSTNGWDTNFDNLVYDSGGAPPPNQQPSVNAGLDLSITLPASATLDATVTDDGLPAPPNLTTAWTKQSGPGSVAFGNAASIDTTATFSQAGVYVLRLTAGDGLLSAFDEVSVNVQAANTPPTVATAAAASPNPTSGTTTQLSVLGADDGGEAALIYTWSVTGSPPG
ncbi:MAG TPA: PQQ-dependent sugar dehydrogenase, partial [Dehalococcoidia bacterium]|nr:PQQ-dependent sugar dehydrogenase [Dehalococcoidia bacterium]